MREIRNLLRSLGAVGESPRPVRRFAQTNRWQQRFNAVIEAITEHWPYEAIWCTGYGHHCDANGIIRPNLYRGTSSASVDAYEHWVDEGCPNLYKQDQQQLIPNLEQEFSAYISHSDVLPSLDVVETEDTGEEIEDAPDTIYAVIQRDGANRDDFLKAVYPLIEAFHQQRGEAAPSVNDIEGLYKKALFEVGDWVCNVDWQGERPDDLLKEDFLNEDVGNWLVEDDWVVNVGSGFSHRDVPSFDDFLDQTQQRLDEAAEEENEIQEYHYEYDWNYTYANPAFEEFTAQLEQYGDVVPPQAVRELAKSLPKYVQSQISRLVEAAAQKKEPITTQLLRDTLSGFNLSFNVVRGDDRYLGTTESGSPFTFCFDDTDTIHDAISNIGKVADYVWGRSQHGHYDDAVAYVRIDGDSTPIYLKGTRFPGEAWVVENIQSDPMRNITDYMGSNGAEKRKKLAEVLQVSKSEVERQLNRLSNYLSEWPFAVAQYLEETARQNDIRYIVWTDSKFQSSRWGINEGTAAYYYDKIPELLGYEHHDKVEVNWTTYYGAWIKFLGGKQEEPKTEPDQAPIHVVEDEHEEP